MIWRMMINMKDDWIKELVFWAMDIHGNTISWCQRECSEEDEM